MEKTRCSWVDPSDPDMVKYHDTEYGVPRASLNACFEVLSLEVFQAGLSWRTILHKRDAFREVFFGFDAARVAGMTEADIARLMDDARIVRNRMKIEATIGNSKCALALEAQGGLPAFIAKFRDGASLSRALKKEGFRFVGKTACTEILTVLGHLPSHQETCFLASEQQRR